jgi:hypothetical protein
MGIKDFIEEAAGAYAADKALEAVDPDAGFLAKAAAAVAGYEGVSAIKEHFAGEQGDAAQADDGQSGDGQSGDDSASS